MTSILDDIRRLDAAHARGEISTIDLAAAKAELIDAVPDAGEPEHIDARIEPPRPRAGIGPILLLCAFVLTICVGVTLLLTGDIMLSATLGITVLAAVTVMLFRQLDG